MSDPDSEELISKNRSKRSVYWLATVSLLTLVALAFTTEAALRFILGLGNPILIAKDPACAYITKPDQNVFRFFVHTRINHFGMRSDDIAAVRPPDEVRILFLGDSITYGTTHVDQRQIFTQVVHRDLPAIIHHPVEVLNASANAWAPDNELAWVLSRGIFQADTVILVLNDGDLTQPRATISQVGDDLPQDKPAFAIEELYARFIRPRVFHIRHSSDAGDKAVPDEVVMRANLQDLDRFLGVVNRQGGQMIVVYLPFRRDIPTPSTSMGRVLRDWSARNRVLLFDLTGVIAPHPVSEICLHDKTHFNAAGNAIIGQALLQSLSAYFQPKLSRGRM